MKDPTAAQGARRASASKALMVTEMLHGRHMFLDPAEATKLLDLLDIRQRPSGELFAYVKGDR